MNLRTADFFQKSGYTSPIDPLDTPAQHLYDAKGKTHMIQLLIEHAEPQALASMMATWMLDRPHWSDDSLGFYPVRERLIDGATGDAESVFLVDVGGSRGHDLEKFLGRHPPEAFPGHLVLQDIADVIESVPQGGEIAFRAQVHDFFTPQPVIGRLFGSILYHLRITLTACGQALGHISFTASFMTTQTTRPESF
jgi:hypothetical protein